MFAEWLHARKSFTRSSRDITHFETDINIILCEFLDPQGSYRPQILLIRTVCP